MAGWIKMPLGTEVDLGPGDIVLDGNPARFQSGEAQHPQFGPLVVAKRLHGSRCHGTGVGFGPGHIVLHEDAAPLKKGHTTPPPFSARVCCGQTAGWIKMPHGREVDLGPSDIVLDGDPAPLSEKEAQPPVFGPCLF